jgi:hypothetical protein
MNVQVDWEKEMNNEDFPLELTILIPNYLVAYTIGKGGNTKQLNPLKNNFCEQDKSILKIKKKNLPKNRLNNK